MLVVEKRSTQDSGPNNGRGRGPSGFSFFGKVVVGLVLRLCDVPDCDVPDCRYSV